jgi:hypothetical protein
MKQTAIWVLVAANLALAATLAFRGVRANTAVAQVPARTAEPGKYILIPADSQLGVGLVFVLDSSNRRLGAIAPNNQDKMEGMATVALDPVFDAAENRAAPNNNTNRRPGNPR